MKGNISKIETMGLVDGPGIRVVIFMQGCPLRCLFCHNPEMWDKKEVNLFTPIELVDFIKRYKPFFENNGGVTFSGGEPLLQQQFLIETCKLLKKEEIHICLDTAGSIKTSNELLELIDLILLDIKALDFNNYKKITNGDMTNFFEFIKKCNDLNKKIWLRQVIIPNINDSKEYIDKFNMFIKQIKNIEKVEFLPYHNMAISKYKELGIDYILKDKKSMDNVECNKLANYFKKINKK